MAKAAEEQQEAPKRDIKKILAFAYVVLNLAAMGVGSYLVYSGTVGFVSPQASSEELNREIAALRTVMTDEPMMYNMESLTTNLSGLPRRLVRAELSLEMLDGEGFEEIIGLGGKGRDAIVRVLNGKTFDDIETVQGKLALKNEIIAQLNGLLERGVVKNIYFSDFVVQ